MLHRSLSPAQPLRTGPLAEHDTRAFRRRLIHFLLIGREHHAVVAFRYLRRNKTLAHVGEYTLGGPRERITVTAASGRIEAENIARMQRIIGVAGRQTLRPIGLGIDPDIAGTTVAAALHAVRRNDVLHRTDGKARLSEIEIFTAHAEPAAKLSRAAGIANKLEAYETRGKFAFDDFDRCDLGIALVDGGNRCAVLAGARAAAASDDLVLHIALPGRRAASADDDGAAAATVGAHFAGNDWRQRGEQSIDERVHRRIVGIDRRWEARIEHAALARLNTKRAQQSTRHIHMRIDHGYERVDAGGLHQRRTNVCWPSGLISRV